MKLLAHYQESLRSIPPSGCGCHPYLLAVSNYGIMSGLDAEQIFSDIRGAIPQGTRRISDREITDAINKAMQDHNGVTFTPRPRPEPVVKDGKAALQKISDQGKISHEADLFEASPIRLWAEPKDDPALLLETLYESTDLIWIGERHDEGIIGKTIRTASDWITHFKNGGKSGPFIIPNPMTGQEGTTKTGEHSLRSDNTVKAYRYSMVEFDGLSRENQIRFWSAVKLPIVALIDSGGKSIHALLKVSKLAQVETFDQWSTQIRGRLYERLLMPLGVDSSCSNPSRLSRLPGHFRTEKQAYQRLLWLSPEGRPIC
jgi:hypothetical protein